MKEGWVTKTVGDICELNPPKSIARKTCTDTVEVSFAPMETLGINQKYFSSPQTKQFKDVIKSYTYFADNDVILAKITPCFENGKLGIAKNLSNGIGFGSSEYIVLRSISNEILPDFLYFYLVQDVFRKEGAKRMTGAVGHKRVPPEFIIERPILLPPLPEQQRLVARLDAAFADIAKAKANAEKNLANVKELFASELSAIFISLANSCEHFVLSDMALDFGRGKSKHRPRNDRKLFEGEYPFIQTGDVRNCYHVINEYSQTYNEVGLAQSKLWPRGTVCITIAANIAEAGVLGFDACFPDSVIGFVPDPQKSTASFVEYSLEFFKINIQAESKGSAQQNINLGTFESFKFPFPPLPEQQRIVARLDELSAHCKQLEALYTQKIALYEALKQSLLQKAFIGEL